MKKYEFSNLIFALALFASPITLATEEDSRVRQEHWARRHTAAGGAIEATNPLLNPLEEFSKLHLNALPHPEVYHIYLHNHEGDACHLVKDVGSQTMRIIRLYGTAGEEAPHYVTRGVPSSMLPKETLVSSSSTTFRGSRRYPTLASTSYPTGVRTYYVMINGKKIELDRGHGVPHADTHVDAGLISTHDSENYVPQNIKYNSPIRRDMEADLRTKKLSYKEISIYHNNFMYNVTARVRGKDVNYNIPIPEGFLFLIFAEGGEIQDTYYFPNFVDYEALKGSRPNYQHFPALYQIPNLSQWFLIPEVTFGLVEDHQEKVDLAQNHASKILLFAPTFFNKFTEEQMPPKARVALLTTLLEWNIEAAASLEFLTFAHQLQLAQFYITSRRNYWELDDRYEAEKQLARTRLLDDGEVSSTTKTLVRFLTAHLPFSGFQGQLQEIVNRFEEVYRSAAFHWEIPQLYPQITKLVAKNGDTHEYNLAMILPTDIPKLKILIGGTSNHSMQRAHYVLSIIDARARQTSSSVMEKLGMMRLYHDNEGLGDEEKHLYWEKAIVEQIRGQRGVTLLDRRRVIDYYSYRRQETEKAFWLQQFVSYVQENPTPENFIQIADWCESNRAAFLQGLEEQVDGNAAANMLALQIYKALNYYSPLLYRDRCERAIRPLQEKLGLYQSDRLGIVRANTLSPVLLAPLIDGGSTGSKLKQLSYIFLRSLYLTNLEKFYAQIPKAQFEQVLAKTSIDFRNEAALYHKLGLKEQAQEKARECFNSANNSADFKEAALILCDIELKEQALIAAQKSFEKAHDYRDFIYAIEAFHKLRQEELKQATKRACFVAIGEKDYNFVSAAIELYKLGLHDFAREAARMNYQRAKKSDDLQFAVRIFHQHGIQEFAIEAANYARDIAKDDADFECVAKNFKYLGLPIPSS